MSINPYEVLGIPPSASEEEIEQAYRLCAKKYHPDRHQDDSEAERKMDRINEAYSILKHGVDPQTVSETTDTARIGDRRFARISKTADYHCKPTGEWEQVDGEDFVKEEDGYYKDAPQIFPGDDPELKRAIASFNRWDFQQTMEILLGMKGSSRNGRWYYVLACTYREREDVASAEEFMRRASELEPDNKVYRHLLNRYRIELKNGGYYSYRKKRPVWLIVLAVIIAIALLWVIASVVQHIISG